MDREIFHCIVKGRVQGVAFRYYTQLQAKESGITGFVRNLPDGSVETAAYGPIERLRSFHIWLHTGSPAALVETVECRTVTPDTAPMDSAENRILLETGAFDSKSEFYTRFRILK